MNASIVWFTQGEITHPEAFNKVLAQFIKENKEESDAFLYWWSKPFYADIYTDIHGFLTAEAAVAHLQRWRKQAERFLEVATLKKIIVHGETNSEIRQALSALNPTYMYYFGGFSRPAPNDRKDPQSDIIWTLEGDILHFGKFKQAMEFIIDQTMNEPDSLTHLWTVSDDHRYFHIMERYLDCRAARLHLDTWQQLGHYFMEAAYLEHFKVYSPLTQELKAGVAAMQPIQMEFINGYSK